MKRQVKMGLFLFLVLGVLANAGAAPMIQYDFGQDGTFENYWKMPVSSVVYIDIYLSNAQLITAGLVSFGLDTYYDPNQLEVTEGTGIALMPDGPWMFGQLDTSVAGEVDMRGASILPVYADSNGNILLGTIELHCTRVGQSVLWTGLAAPPPYDNFVDSSGLVWDDNIVFTTALIENTPLPGTLFLLGSGLVGLVGLGSRNRFQFKA